jgi:N-carbamoylputrescine amidase
MRGAQVLFYPTAIGWLPDEKAEQGENQLAAWQTIQRAHAIANGVFTVAVNRVGTETSSAGEIEFWGHSFVCAPNGALLAEAGQADEVLVAHCDLSQNEETRRTWPFFRDRRIDAYSDLLKRWSD